MGTSLVVVLFLSCNLSELYILSKLKSCPNLKNKDVLPESLLVWACMLVSLSASVVRHRDQDNL